MAMNPRDIKVTREDMDRWLSNYDGQVRDTKKLRDYLEQCLTDEGLDPEAMVNTTGHDSLGDETPLVEMLMMDLESYGY